MRRALILMVACMPLAGCALPKLPSLPSIGQIKDAVVPPTSGESVREAVALAGPKALEWAPDVQLVAVRGSKIDTGGRDAGLAGGQWLAEYQSATKKLKYAVRVVNGKPPSGTEAPFEEDLTTLDPTLAGLIDSTDAIAKAGLGASSYAVILRATPDGPRYDVIGEGSVKTATLDARNGAKL